MKTIMKLFLCLIMTTQVAFATSNDGLKQAMDEFHFAMTVEWDQQDQTFAQTEKLKFQATIEKLISDGLTLDELKTAFNEKSQLNADQIIAEIDERNITDPHEVQMYIQQKLQSNYARGASWSGEIYEVIIATVLIVLVGGTIIQMVICRSDPQC
jgi:hypothetical protein